MVYINAISSHNTLKTDIKELIPNPVVRRRMSTIVKYGVAVGMECINEVGSENVDAIITATGLGCLADSEKFLKIIIENNEDLLNPTPFIQSTFNTVGGQIALLCENHSYNMTYTHRGSSLESALLDAILLIENDEAKNVLVGAFDFNTPALENVLKGLKLWQGKELGEGSFFFLLSKEKTSQSIAGISLPEFLSEPVKKEELSEKYDNLLYNKYENSGVFHTASASVLFDALSDLKKDTHIYNSYLNNQPTLTHLYVL